VRLWGRNKHPLRFPTPRLAAPQGAWQWLSPDKTRGIATPIRFKGWEPECVICSGRRSLKEFTRNSSSRSASFFPRTPTQDAEKFVGPGGTPPISAPVIVDVRDCTVNGKGMVSSELGRVKYGVSGTRCPRNSSWRSEEEPVRHFIRNPESQADGPVRSVAYGCAEVGSTAKTAARTRSTIADAFWAVAWSGQNSMS